MGQYPREAWRPALEGNHPACELARGHPVRVWDQVAALRLHRRHRTLSDFFKCTCFFFYKYPGKGLRLREEKEKSLF